MLLALLPAVFFGVFLTGDLARLAGDLDLALVAVFLVGDLARAGDLALLLAGVLVVRKDKGKRGE